MATYSTDLTTITTAEAGTWTEFASPYNGGGTPGASGENFIQGTDCFAQNTGKSTGLEISCVFDNGSNYTFATDDVLLAWVYYSVGTNLETYANSGWRFGIGSSNSAWDWYRIGGSDYGRNPYGGWTNVAIDPTATETGTIGGGNGGSYRYFGNVPYTINEISKGDPNAVDALREGRCEISMTGAGVTFSELAEYNDYNAGGTPPGTSSTSVDSGRHRLGLFQETGGTYLWKGLMSVGLTATSVTFTDSNETIIVDDCPHTYAEFNKIEINHASSTVTWTNITFTSIATTTVAVGRFECVDNATVNLNGCTFNSMDTFIFDSNTTADACAFNGCALITLGEADIAGSSILASTVVADEGAVYDNRTTTAATDLTEYTGCTFSQGATDHHAIRFGTNVDDDLTITGADFSGFNAADDHNGSVFRFDATTGSLNLNLVDCTHDGSGFTVDDAAGITVTVVVDPVATKVTVVDAAGDPIESVRVLAETADDGGGSGFPYQAAVTSLTQAAGVATLTATAVHGLETGDYVTVRGATPQGYNKQAQITVTSTTVFTYSVDSGLSTPAGGTPVFSYAALSGTTNASGVIQSSKTWPASQGLNGRCRKSTTAPYYKTGRFTITDASGGSDVTVQMILDG